MKHLFTLTSKDPGILESTPKAGKVDAMKRHFFGIDLAYGETVQVYGETLSNAIGNELNARQVMQRIDQQLKELMMQNPPRNASVGVPRNLYRANDHHECKVIHASEFIEDHGWDIVETIPGQRIESASREIVNPREDQRDYLPTITVYDNIVIDDPFLVLRRPIQNRIDEYQNTAATLEQQKQQLEKEIIEYETRCKDLQRSFETIKESEQHQHKMRYDLAARSVAIEKANQKMEQDIAKLREHFGSKAISEALGQ